jgi:uncharacterized membrane protein YhaH (DUF805 family)
LIAEITSTMIVAGEFPDIRGDVKMRGEIIQTFDATGAGLISGADGQRYNFTPTDLKSIGVARAGDAVDFVPSGGMATAVFVLRRTAADGDAGTADGDLGLWAYFTKCMGLYFNGAGRARRKEYWSFALFRTLFVLGFFMVALIALGLIGTAAQAATGDQYADAAMAVFWVFWLILDLPFVAPGFSVASRRLHDIGLSGWLALVALVPYLGGLFMLVVALIPSQAGANAYGASPKLQHRMAPA